MRISGRHLFRCMVIIVSLPVILVTAHGQQHATVDTDLCSLVGYPKQFNGKWVRIHARVESAVIEGGTALFNDSCKSQGITLLIVPASRENPDFKALDDAIVHQGNIGTVGKRITGTFAGRFVFHAKGQDRRVLEADQLEKLEVR